MANLGLEVATILALSLSQPLEGSGLRVIYLEERECCQLAREDAPRGPIDPLVFMLAPRSMTDAEYDLWGPSIPFTNQVTYELEYDKFSGARLMLSVTISVCVLASFIFL